MKRITELILYRDPDKGKILKEMAWIMEHDGDEKHLKEIRDRSISLWVHS